MCVGTGAYVEDAAGAAVGRSDRVDKGVGEFIIVEEGVESIKYNNKLRHSHN